MFQALVLITSREYVQGPNDRWQWSDTGVTSQILQRETEAAVDEAASKIEEAVARITTHTVDVIHLGEVS